MPQRGDALTVGLVGGLGPESTIDGYRRILQLREAERPGSSPSIVIHSLDVNRGIELVRHDRPNTSSISPRGSPRRAENRLPETELMVPHRSRRLLPRAQ